MVQLLLEFIVAFLLLIMSLLKRSRFSSASSLVSLSSSLIFLLIVVAAASTGRPVPYRESKLEYYVQVLVGDISLNATFLPALSRDVTFGFGGGELFAFNVTKGPKRTSQLVGYCRGYTVNTSYTPEFRALELETISYNDGRYDGTIHIQAEVVAGTTEVPIVGGTGSFRGARGYGFVERLLLDGPYRLFRHELHFMW